jgi:hypothetical protein
MYKLFSALFLCFLVFQLNAQSSTEKQVVIVACKEGSLFIDGIPMGSIAADDANRQKLSFGEHYLQLKNGTEKISLTIVVDENMSSIIKLGCGSSIARMGKRLIDKQLSLTGMLSKDMEENIIGLDKDDEIILNCSVINKKGTATIFINELNTGNEIYKKQDFKSVENEKISINSKGIYKITLYTDALFGKDAKLSIDRIPSKNSSPSFNTNPKRVWDTTFTEVLKTEARVYSTGNLSHQNKTAISINLPANTSYWTYWIGVDQPAKEEMGQFISNLSPLITAFSVNPLVLFGMKLIPSLPMMKSPSTVNYKFMDTPNAKAYINGLAHSYYKFKHADNITTDYSLINVRAADLVLAMENENSFTGFNVDIRVVAFMIRSKLVLDE